MGRRVDAARQAAHDGHAPCRELGGESLRHLQPHVHCPRAPTIATASAFRGEAAPNRQRRRRDRREKGGIAGITVTETCRQRSRQPECRGRAGRRRHSQSRIGYGTTGRSSPRFDGDRAAAAASELGCSRTRRCHASWARRPSRSCSRQRPALRGAPAGVLGPPVRSRSSNPLQASLIGALRQSMPH